MNSSSDLNMVSEAENLNGNENILGVGELHITDSTANQDEDRFDFDDVALDITQDKNGGVLKKILKEGEGDECPGFGDKVFVHYTGWRLGKEPVEFDSSRKGQKIEFNVGRGQVISGWDLGIATMRRGEVSLFICHPRYAYGEIGYPPAIPPHTPLLFEIELFDWKPEDLSPKRDESILRKVLERGEGSGCPNEGSLLRLEIIEFREGQKMAPEEKEFILGEGCVSGVPEGLEIALLKFSLGERSTIFLRKKYLEEVLKVSDPNGQLQYEITLLHFEKAKNVWEMNSDEKLQKAKESKEKGVHFYKLGLYRVALKQFKWIVSCLENEPGVSEDTREERRHLLLAGYLNLALCYSKLDNHQDVVRACTKALSLDPGNEKALFRRGQAKFETNDCEEALADFEQLSYSNKAAKNMIGLCHNKMRQQRLRDKGTYDKMFELFVKQDEDRARSTRPELGVWSAEEEAERERREYSSALLDANVIELSNTVHDGNVSFQL